MEQPNIKYIKDLAGGDEAFELKFIGILKDEFPVERKDYEASIKDGDMEKAGAFVHKIKHKFNILGMEEAYTYAVAYEDELRAGNFGKDQGFKAFLNTVTNFLKSL